MQDIFLDKQVVLDSMATWDDAWSIDSKRTIEIRLKGKDKIASLDIYKFYEPDHWLRVLRKAGHEKLADKAKQCESSESDCSGDFADFRKKWIWASEAAYKRALREAA
jgi:hypothetical protein